MEETGSDNFKYIKRTGYEIDVQDHIMAWRKEVFGQTCSGSLDMLKLKFLTHYFCIKMFISKSSG